MKFKYFSLFISSLVLIIFLLGCSNIKNEKSLIITNKSNTALITDNDSGRAITFTASIQNNSSKTTEPFYVEYEIKDKWLRSKLKSNQYIVGQDVVGKKLKGRLFTVKSNTTFQIAGTYKIKTPIDEEKLKKIIQQNKAIKVNLLDKEEKLLTSNLITNYLNKTEDNSQK